MNPVRGRVKNLCWVGSLYKWRLMIVPAAPPTTETRASIKVTRANHVTTVITRLRQFYLALPNFELVNDSAGTFAGEKHPLRCCTSLSPSLLLCTLATGSRKAPRSTELGLHSSRIGTSILLLALLPANQSEDHGATFLVSRAVRNSLRGYAARTGIQCNP